MYKELLAQPQEQRVSTRVLPPVTTSAADNAKEAMQAKSDQMFGYKTLRSERRNQKELGVHRFRNVPAGLGTGIPQMSTR